MEIRTKKIASLVLVATIVLGVFMALDINTAMGDGYPPLPTLTIATSGDTADVWLSGETGSLDPWWCIDGIDLILQFDPSQLQGLYFYGDPGGEFAAFWGDGLAPVPDYAWTMDNTAGYVRTVLVGVPDEETGWYMPPEGTIHLLTVIFDGPILSPLRLEVLPKPNGEPGDRAIREPWGYEYFAIHMAELGTGLPVPFIGGPPVAKIMAHCIAKVGEVVAFDASGSYGAVSYEWDFTNDGITDKIGQTVSWTFGEPGVHRATLTVTDYLGNTNVASMRILCNKETLLQNVDVEHKVYDVSADENDHNTLTVTVRNLGPVTGKVRAEFAFEDKRTGIPDEGILAVEDDAPAGSRVDLKVDFHPDDFGYQSGTIAGYDSTVTLFFWCDRLGLWVQADTFKLTFKVVP